MVVGITGGIGSGKTTIVKMFAKFENVAIYFSDEEAKKLMNTSPEIKKFLIAEFSDKVYLNGVLNRPFLAAIVFKDKEKLRVLNAIVHPVVHQHFQCFITENKNKDYIIYENAILFENGSDSLCDKIVTVIAPHELKIKRVVFRDSTTKEAVENRMKNQWFDVKKAIQSHYIINNEILTNSEDEVLWIHNKLTKR